MTPIDGKDQKAVIDAGPPRLLVIDDAASVRALIVDTLRFLGYRVDEAADGQEGLSLFDQHAYDLVLTDYLMPGLTGRDVIEAIHRKEPTAHVIMLTGHANAPDVEGLRRQGVLVLEKPLGIPELKSAITAMLGSTGG